MKIVLYFRNSQSLNYSIYCLLQTKSNSLDDLELNLYSNKLSEERVVEYHSLSYSCADDLYNELPELRSRRLNKSYHWQQDTLAKNLFEKAEMENKKVSFNATMKACCHIRSISV